MKVPTDRRYSKDHEWILREDATGVIGITDFAQSQLGDVVFVDLPPMGKRFKRGEPFGVVESVKTVSDLFCPADGVVSAVNETLKNAPETVNQDPYGVAWMIKLTLDTPETTEDLLDAAAYEALVKTL